VINHFHFCDCIQFSPSAILLNSTAVKFRMQQLQPTLTDFFALNNVTYTTPT